MKNPLQQITEENIFTLLSFYEFIKEKSEKCLSNISKFNKYTASYYANIKDIFINDENSINSKNEFEKNLNNKLENPFYTDIVMQNNKNIRKKMNIFPIMENISKINKLFINFVECIELFTKSIDNLLLFVNQTIEKNKTKINDIKNNYSLEKQNFLQKFTEFEELNKNLGLKYFEQEKNLIQNIIKLKSSNLNEKEKEANENEINLKIYDTKKYQKEVEDQFKKLDKFGIIFNDFYERNINGLKEVLNDFFKEFESQINNILILYKKSFLTKMNELLTDKNIFHLYESNFHEIIKENIIIIDKNFFDIKFDEYKIKILNKKYVEEKEKDENTKSLFNLIKNSNQKLDERDILYIVKKMYNFKYINKKDYKIEIQKEIINLNEKIDKLFFYAKYKSQKNSNSNLISDLNKINDNTDVINDTSNEKEDDDYDDEIIKNGPTVSEIDYICKLMNKKEYSRHFLLRLNNFRAFCSIPMPFKIYNYIVKIFLEISKYLIETKQTDLGKKFILDYDNIRSFFILSQTFFYMKDGKKCYLQKGLNKIELFNDAELWENLLDYNITEEMDKIAKKMKKSFTEKEYFERSSNLCLMQILPYISSFHGFGIDKEKIEEIANFFINKYNLKDNEKAVIFQTINSSED